MAGDGDFVLGVDFGTSNTVAMLRRPDGRVTPLLFDGTPVLPSAVFAGPDATLSVGQDALHHGRHRPDGLEPNPKRRIDDGSVLLGRTECAVPDVVGAVLRRVADEANRVAGRPRTLVLSHPAAWGPVRRLTLKDAADAAGLPVPVFVPEPVAAAMYFTSVLRTTVRDGAALVVYDLGAGTFDVTVLRAGPSFEVLGCDGLDVGGLDVDAAVVGWLRPRYDDTTWTRLSEPRTVDDRRLRHDLWTEARVAKEMLSRTSAVIMRPPLLDAEVPLTLEDFERITRPLIDRTVRTALGLTRYCEVTAAHVLLVGGSSRIPLVATALHRAFAVAPTVTEQPETVVAEGCVFAPAATATPVDADLALISGGLSIAAGLSTDDVGGGPPAGRTPWTTAGHGVLPAVLVGPVAGTPPRTGSVPLTGAVPVARAEPGAGAIPVAGSVSAGSAAAAEGAPVGAGVPVAGAAPPPGVPVVGVAPAPLASEDPEPASLTLPAGLLWPPLPPDPPGQVLDAAFDTSADTMRLVPRAHGSPCNAGPGRPNQRGRATASDDTTAVRAVPVMAGPGFGGYTAPPAQSMPPRQARPGRGDALAPTRQLSAQPIRSEATAVDLPPTLLDLPTPPIACAAIAAPPATAPRAAAPAVAAPVHTTSAGRTSRRDPAARAATRSSGGPTPPTDSGVTARQYRAVPPPRQVRPPAIEPAPPRPATAPATGTTDRGRAHVGRALLIVVLLLATAAVTLIVTRVAPPGRDRAGSDGGPAANAAFPTWTVRYADSLSSQRGWSAAADPDEMVECAFRHGRLEIEMRKGGIFRCPGQRDELRDFALRLDVYLLDGRACAGVWFRRDTHESGRDSAYVLKVCPTEFVLAHHHASGDIAEFARFAVPGTGAGVRSAVGVVARGGELMLYLDDAFVGRHRDTAYPGGRIALGIAVPRDLGAGTVGFGNVELRTP